MISEIDIYRSAQVLIRELGEEAPLVAAQVADQMLARGDVEGLAVWKRILAAVDELQRAQKAEGQSSH